MQNNRYQFIPYLQKMERNEEKITRLLTFLGTGEIWTVARVVGVMFDINEDSARKFLKSLVAKGFIKEERHNICMAKDFVIYGVTKRGLNKVNLINKQNGFIFNLSPKSIAKFTHKIEGQLIRVAYERIGVTDWQPESVYSKKYKIGALIPDGVFTFDGKKIAFEMELEIKSVFRMQKVLNRYCRLLSDHCEEYDQVVYYTDQKEALTRLFSKINLVCFLGEYHPFKYYRNRFIIRDLWEIPQPTMNWWKSIMPDMYKQSLLDGHINQPDPVKIVKDRFFWLTLLGEPINQPGKIIYGGMNNSLTGVTKDRLFWLMDRTGTVTFFDKKGSFTFSENG